jgi:hypothetical protein
MPVFILKPVSLYKYFTKIPKSETLWSQAIQKRDTEPVALILNSVEGSSKIFSKIFSSFNLNQLCPHHLAIDNLSNLKTSISSN